MQQFISMTYDANGNLLTITDKNQHVTTFTYNNMDRLVSISNPMNNGTIRYTYDLMGNITRIDYPNGGWQSYTYNNKYQVISTTTLLGTTRYEYDAVGNVTKIILPNAGELRFTYNDANEILSVTDQLGAVTTLTRNALGFVVSETDAMNRVTQYTFNNMNQLTAINENNLATVGLSLNLNGELVAVTDPNQHTVTTTRDAHGRPTSVRDAENNTFTKTFDNANHLTGGTDARGISFTITYNANYQITAINWSNGESETYTLDAEGQPTIIANANGSFTIERNANDFVTAIEGPFTNDRTVYQRNNIGLATQITYEQGKTVTNAFNELGMQTQMNAWGNVAATTTYNALGLPLTRNLGGVITETNTYNVRGELTNKSYTKTGGQELFRQNITRNALGEPTQNDLVPFIMPSLTIGEQNLTYKANDVIQTAPYTSDANGNILTFPNGLGQVIATTFDGKNRIVTLQYGTTTVTNLYDAGNFLISQTINGVTKRYIWDYANGLPHIIRETDANGQTLASYFWTSGQLVARIDANNTVLYYLHDAYGNVVALADATGNVTDRYSYAPNGEGMNHATGTTQQPFTWLGAYGILHQLGDIYYIRQRWYDAKQGRFLSQDVFPADAAMTQSLNRYVYGMNSPTTWLDPTGLASQDITDYASKYSSQLLKTLNAKGITLNQLKGKIAERLFYRELLKQFPATSIASQVSKIVGYTTDAQGNKKPITTIIDFVVTEGKEEFFYEVKGSLKAGLSYGQKLAKKVLSNYTVARWVETTSSSFELKLFKAGKSISAATAESALVKLGKKAKLAGKFITKKAFILVDVGLGVLIPTEDDVVGAADQYYLDLEAIRQGFNSQYNIDITREDFGLLLEDDSLTDE